MPRKHGEFSSVREAIIVTASDLFTKQGVHGTSLGDIATQGDLSKGTLYYYYPAKDDLILATATICLNKMTDILLAWIGALDREDSMATAITNLINSLTEDENNARLYVVLCTECTIGNTMLQNLMRQRIEEWRVMLEVGTLRIQSRNAQLLGTRAELFFTLISGHMLQSLGGLFKVPLEDLVQLLLE